jgi:hypothetical protein
VVGIFTSYFLEKQSRVVKKNEKKSGLQRKIDRIVAA